MAEILVGRDRILEWVGIKGITSEPVGVHDDPTTEVRFLRGREESLRRELKIPGGNFDPEMAWDWLAVKGNLLMLEGRTDDAKMVLGVPQDIMKSFGKRFVVSMMKELEESGAGVK